MAENALAKKLKLKPGQRAAFIGAPEGYLKTLQPLPARDWQGSPRVRQIATSGRL